MPRACNSPTGWISTIIKGIDIRGLLWSMLCQFDDRLQTLAILLIGFSVFSALNLTLTHFTGSDYRDQPLSRWAGIVLLLSLAGLQLGHYAFLSHGTEFIHGPYYSLLLFTVAPAFYLFSAPLLKAQAETRPLQWGHLLPLLAAPFLPYHRALPLSFLIGAGYLLWLAMSIYALRAQRERFRLELGVLAAIFLIAVGVLVLGLIIPALSERLFFTLYAIAIGLAFVLTSIGLAYSPQIATEVAEAARETYAVSTLANVDCGAVLARLKALMEEDKLYQEAELDLATLAGRLGLSSHQLSELINARLGKGFSRYVREYRVEAAKVMLLGEPSASVLSVGLSVGFTSQSNFYEAFREITGMTPGLFRKLNS
jgi:AraC-like DNA-binding protein